MDSGIYAAATGLTESLRAQEVTANNLANVNTPGYKRRLALFHPFHKVLYIWIASGSLHTFFGTLAEVKIPLSLQLDPLTSVMVLFVSFVGFWIHIYSIGYMHKDPGFTRFFAYINLFMFAMLLLVLADNFLLMFVGWEGVGLCSYLLIGFWFTKPSAAAAAVKAFLTTRVGDVGLLFGIALLWREVGRLDYPSIFAAAESASPEFLAAVGLLLFVGAAGKSAQFPLHIWLPEAMEGPTPVSALIHAATMVTSGVYMICRLNFLYELAPIAMDVVAWVGVITAFYAATIAVFQNDIKKVLAYSTISVLSEPSSNRTVTLISKPFPDVEVTTPTPHLGCLTRSPSLKSNSASAR